MVYTHMIVREDAVELCGFADTGELNCFIDQLSLLRLDTKGDDNIPCTVVFVSFSRH